MAGANYRPLTLERGDPNVLPLAFEIDETLTGRREPFRDTDTGKRMAGRLLDARLGEMPLGIKTVTLSGELNPPDSPAGLLVPWDSSGPAVGTLDVQGLISVCFALIRKVAESYGRKRTPPQLYIYELHIVPKGPPRGPEPPPEPPRKPQVFRQRIIIKGRKQAIYRDKKSGRFASKSTWTEERKRR